MRFTGIRPGVLALALAIAFFLWAVAHGTTSIELIYDIPVVLYNTPEGVVVTDQNVSSVNVRVSGSRAAVSNISQLQYEVDLSGGKPGIADYEVEISRIENDLPGGARVTSHSPSRVQVRFEEKGRKVVNVRADLTGKLPEGFRLADVKVAPRRVWLIGARSNVLRMEEVGTEPIDLNGLEESVERDVALKLGSGTVWAEEDRPVKVILQIVREPDAEELPAADALEGKESESG